MPVSTLRREVVVRGIHLSYLEREPASKPAKAPILLLHGLIATAESFAHFIPFLPADRRIVAVDLLTAHTIDPESLFDVSFSGFASLIVDFSAAIGLDHPILLGHSHGGVLSLQVAASFRTFPSGLILISPAHPFGGYSDTMVSFYASSWGRRLAGLLPHLPRRLQMFGINRMTGPRHKFTLAESEPYCAALRLPKTVPRVMRLVRHWQRNMASLRIAMEQAPIATPTVLLWGQHDPVVPLSTAPALESHLTHWERVSLPGIGHLPVEESPEETAAVIKDWLIHRGP